MTAPPPNPRFRRRVRRRRAGPQSLRGELPRADHRDHDQPSVFLPDNLIREARRQKGLAAAPAPALAVLDPDGDIVRYLQATDAAELWPEWPCYHSTLFQFTCAGRRVGIIGCAVGAPYAVLVAEQLFACGTALVVSITSAGLLAARGPLPHYVLIERAFRDEGTSHRYRPPRRFAHGDPALIDAAEAALATTGLPVYRGGTWTTDAPFRETEALIARGRALDLAGIEMESAGLYALAEAKACPVLCIAHITNTMAVTEGDFEKGTAGGAPAALTLIEALVRHMPLPGADAG